MFPERLPSETDSEAERRLFEAFRDEFSDDWVVFAQVSWLAQRRDRATDGEADFVVAHPRYGALVIEVKGGGIAYAATTKSYTSTDRHDMQHAIKNPFRQARDSMHALISKLGEADQTSKQHYGLGYAVAFPDIYVDGDLGPDAPSEIVIDAARTGYLKQAIVDVFRYWKLDAEPIGDEGIQALTDLIGRSWQVETTIGREITHQERIIRLLTEEQFKVLDVLGSRRRALITGCAGSGKTMLAMEKARRLAEAGYRVLITCFNQNLGDWLAASLKPYGITAQRFLSLCAQYATKAGVLQRGPDESDSDFYSRLPEALCKALDVLPDRFDAIIVDEGQDFEEEWWVAIASLLADPNDGVLYIFYDDNQRLYNRGAAFPINDEPFHLPANCRNTQRIHEAVMVFYQSDTVPPCLGPEGTAPMLHDFGSGADERKGVEKLIDDLVANQKVNPGDIAILTRRARDRSAWANPPTSSAWAATWDLSAAGDKVICSTIHAFKGLERPFVIVCELQGVDATEKTELLYVAFSRAREYLAVVGLDTP
jgi:UvrD-like helicase C-terminal domain/Nuclease-related domain/AAA ATPase domain